MEDSKTQRENNHKGFVEVLVSNNAAMKILESAKAKLIEFYSPAMVRDAERKGKADAGAGVGVLNPNEFGPGAMSVMRGMTSLSQEERRLKEGSDSDEDLDEDDDGDDDRGRASSTVLQMLAKLRTV